MYAPKISLNCQDVLQRDRMEMNYRGNAGVRKTSHDEVSATESLKVLSLYPWRPTLVLSTEKDSKVFLKPNHIMLGDRNQKGKRLSQLSWSVLNPRHYELSFF